MGHRVELAEQAGKNIRGRMEAWYLGEFGDSIAASVRSSRGYVSASAFEKGYIDAFFHDTDHHIVAHVSTREDGTVQIDTGDNYVLVPGTVIAGSSYSTFEFLKKKGR